MTDQPKKILEKKIEEKVCTYAKDKGFLVYKFTSPQRRSVPDRLLIHPFGKVIFIEFKRDGAKPTPSQALEHTRLRCHNIEVYIIDDIDQGKSLIDELCRRWDPLKKLFYG